jgi:ABC-type transporter Mla subunit MlaD
MMFLGGLLIAIFALACQAVPLVERQSNESTFGLYAYGTNINGLPVFYADGEFRHQQTDISRLI